MSNKRPTGRNVIDQASIKGSALDGIVEIEDAATLDAVAGGDGPYGPPNTPPPSPQPYPPPTTYPGQPPIPNSPAYGPFPSSNPR